MLFSHAQISSFIGQNTIAMTFFLSLATSRYSQRNYDASRIVAKETLLRVLECGRMAPSASNRQPWKIVVVQSEVVLNQLQKAYAAPWFREVNTVLVVKGYPEQAWIRSVVGYNAIETDLTIFMDHLVLAAHAEGLSTCWIAAFDPHIMQQALALKDDEVVFAMTPIGYFPDGKPVVRQKSRKPLDEIVEWM